MSNYRDRLLIDYLPDVLQMVREYQAITTAEQPEIYRLFDEAEKVLDNQFIETAGEYGISRWEKMLSISPKPSETLDERRFSILARLNEQLPYTIRSLEHLLKTLCGEGGYSIELIHNDYILHVGIALISKSKFDDVDSLLNRICPANLVITTYLKYNQHSTLARYTHAQLAAYTHEELRSEVLT